MSDMVKRMRELEASAMVLKSDLWDFGLRETAAKVELIAADIRQAIYEATGEGEQHANLES